MLNQFLEFFNKFIVILEELTKIMTNLIKNLNNSSINYEELAMNFFYLKDVELENFIKEKEDLSKYNKILKGIAKIDKNYSFLLESSINNNLLVNKKLNQNFLSQLKGIVLSINIWNEFIYQYKIVESLCNNYDGNKDLEEVNNEFINACKVKNKFYDNLNKELKEFTGKNKLIFYDIIQDFKNLLLYLNLHV